MGYTVFAGPGTTSFTDINGTTFIPNANGWVSVPNFMTVQSLLESATGVSAIIQALPCTTAKRPPTTDLLPGMCLFDTTLNKPIWRNTANSAWIDATGATV